MPIQGDLSEFPLPEVLLLIGSRTGRLRLFDSREFLPMELDLAECRAHGLRIGEAFNHSAAQIIAELSYTVETGDGRFEFTVQPIIPVDTPLPVSELVMQLVLRVDERLASQNAVLGPELFYILQDPTPDCDMDPDLLAFFRQARQLLSDGVRAEDLAEYMGVDINLVKGPLYNLHQLGFVKLVETTDVETLREMILAKEISQLTHDFSVVAEASEIMRRSGRMLRIPLPSVR